MRSLDTNILLYAFNTDCEEFERAHGLLEELRDANDVVICELVLVELYLLVRNQAVLREPLSAGEAAQLCEIYRAHPRWRLVDNAPIMGDVWRKAAIEGSARRWIVDARLAFTLLHHGVTELITRNAKDFREFGFERVWDPFA